MSRTIQRVLANVALDLGVTLSHMHDNTLFSIALTAAVPLWVERLKRQPLAQLMEQAPAIGQLLAEKGDTLQFGSKKRGEAAHIFNEVAKGMAILSFCPGGVTFQGAHFENEHPDRKPADTT